MEIVKKENEIFNKEVDYVREVSPEIIEILNQMEALINQNNLESISANQLGINKNLLVFKYNHKIIKLIDPVIIYSTGKANCFEDWINFDEEDFYPLIFNTRRLIIEALAIDVENQLISITAHGNIAFLLQKQIDILQGKIITDKNGRYIFETKEEREYQKLLKRYKIIEEPAIYAENNSLILSKVLK